MNKSFKSIIAGAIASTLVFTNAMVIFAADTSTVDSNTTTTSVGMDTGISTYSEDYKGHNQNVSTSWKTIATSTTGFNHNVFIECRNPDLAPLDIRMLGKNGNIVWSESGAVGAQSNRMFWCGSDVYTIQAKSQRGISAVYIQPGW